MMRNFTDDLRCSDRMLMTLVLVEKCAARCGAKNHTPIQPPTPAAAGTACSCTSPAAGAGDLLVECSGSGIGNVRFSTFGPRMMSVSQRFGAGSGAAAGLVVGARTAARRFRGGAAAETPSPVAA